MTTKLSSEAMKRARPVMRTAHAPRCRSERLPAGSRGESMVVGRVKVVVIEVVLAVGSPPVSTWSGKLLVVSDH